MKQVYLCLDGDAVHMGHIDMIQKAAALGEVTVGVLVHGTAPVQTRLDLFRSIRGVAHTIPQHGTLYETNLRRLRPDYVVCSGGWSDPVRANVRQVLAEIGGELVEFSTAYGNPVEKTAGPGQPQTGRKQLRDLLASGGIVRAVEAHSGLTGLLAENASAMRDRQSQRFEALWVSSLCDATARGKPDMELVSFRDRVRRVGEIMAVTQSPILFDGDTGGTPGRFAQTIRVLEELGVSAVVIEDKTGQKRNSLFGAEAEQVQVGIDDFCHKIQAGKQALETGTLMLIARIESLVLGQGLDDALTRAKAYIQAGADGILIHSCQHTPDEIFAFCNAFRQGDKETPLAVVPTTYSSVTEKELETHGVNLVLYANQLTRAAVPAMIGAAQSILQHGRAKETEPDLMPYTEIIRLIPEE